MEQNREPKNKLMHLWLTHFNKGFPGGSKNTSQSITVWMRSGKNPPADAGDADLIPGLERSSAEAKGNPPQYSCLGNPVDTGAWHWQAIVHVVTESWT